MGSRRAVNVTSLRSPKQCIIKRYKVVLLHLVVVVVAGVVVAAAVVVVVVATVVAEAVVVVAAVVTLCYIMVGTVRSRAQTTEFSFFLEGHLITCNYS
jgi:hypothetical protein